MQEHPHRRAGERVDTKMLEVLGELDRGTSLPIGLRVDATLLIEASAGSRAVPAP